MAKKITEEVKVEVTAKKTPIEKPKTPAKKTPAKKAPTEKLKAAAKKKTDKKPEPELTMPEIRAKIDEIIAKYSDHARFNEAAKMLKLETEAKALEKKYNDLSEDEAMQALKRSDDPMKALALAKSYPTIMIRTGTDKATKQSVMTISDKSKTLDPLRLHNRVSGGIGHDKTRWPGLVGRLWDNLVAEGAGRVGLDAKKIRDTIYTGEAAKLLKLHAEEKEFGDEMLLDCLQEVLDAMLGPGYAARPELVQKMKNEIGASPADVANCKNISPDQFRKRFVGILHLTVTGKMPELETKQRKR